MSKWVLDSERHPEKPGEYEVCKAIGLPLHGYKWSGEQWITPSHKPTEAVYSWLDGSDKKKNR